MKTKLTSIGSVADEVSSALDGMRSRLLACVGQIETEIAGQEGGDASEHSDVA